MTPRVSVILPAYDSHRTLFGCLAALRRQTFRDFEVIVVDSGPDPHTAGRLPAEFPEVRLERSRQRLLPHAARNRGARGVRGELLAFSDPDVYAHPDWLERLVAAHDRHAKDGHGVTVGALACHGDRWLDRGIHLCKFSKWLPAGPPRSVDMSPTANMLVDRGLFEEIGGFEGHLFLGDLSFSWEALERVPLCFEPRAVVEHHHLSGPVKFLRERFRRGVLYGRLRGHRDVAGPARRLLFLIVSLLPLRLARNLWLVGRHSARAGLLTDFLATLPLVAAGFAASLLGESVAYGRGLWPGGAGSSEGSRRVSPARR